MSYIAYIKPSRNCGDDRSDPKIKKKEKEGKKEKIYWIDKIGLDWIRLDRKIDRSLPQLYILYQIARFQILILDQFIV